MEAYVPPNSPIRVDLRFLLKSLRSYRDTKDQSMVDHITKQIKHLWPLRGPTDAWIIMCKMRNAPIMRPRPMRPVHVHLGSQENALRILSTFKEVFNDDSFSMVRFAITSDSSNIHPHLWNL